MTHIARILCPVDFSDYSRHALDHAVAVAKWYEAAISVLYVHRLSMPMFVGPYMGTELMQPVAMTDAERADVLQGLADFVAPDRAAGIHLDTLLAEDFVVPRAIVEHAASLKADLITLGTHGRSGFQRLVLGSVAEKVLRTAECPVMTVPPRVGDAKPRQPGSLERILCPLDFSSTSARALEYAAGLARNGHARLTVVHIVELGQDVPEPPLPEFFDYRNSRFEQARRYLAHSIPASVRLACPVDELLLVGKPYREILWLAKEQQADLIVMGVRGREAGDLAFFGSTANHVVRNARCPVMTIRERISAGESDEIAGQREKVTG